MDSSLHLVPGHCKAAPCSWGVLDEGRSRMGKKQKINSPQAYLRVCVCVLCRLHICTCVFQCVVCALKNLTKVFIIILIMYLCVCMHVCVCVWVCVCVLGSVHAARGEFGGGAEA